MKKISWPDGKSFAFTIFDDTDQTTIQNGPPVYDMLTDYGFRTTKSVWPIKGTLKPHTGGSTCEDPDYLVWVQKLQNQGFEIALHNITYHTSTRFDIIKGFEKYKEYFGSYPNIHVNHTGCYDGIYWGESRLSGVNKFIYNLLTQYKNKHKFHGHDPKSDQFWGDICQQNIKYVRNFVYPWINTLKTCPYMPYFDPKRPFVNYWFASTNGSPVYTFNKVISKKNQDYLEQEGGACIMYTHFGSSFYKENKINEEFKNLMYRLSKKNGWYVPVSTLLDYLLQQKKTHNISNFERTEIEEKWLIGKLIH